MDKCKNALTEFPCGDNCTNEISVSDVNSDKNFSRDYLYVFKNALPKICC